MKWAYPNFSSKVVVRGVPDNIEDILNEEYVKFWDEAKVDPPMCSVEECVHVSEITYGTPRSTGVQPTMILGLEAEEGLCSRARKKPFDPDKINFICKEPSRFVAPLETRYGTVWLVGTIDAWVWLPKRYGGPALVPMEKKTGVYRINQYGFKKHVIAREQGVIYSWLSRVGAFVIQHDGKDGSKYLVKHEFYIALWPEREEEFVQTLVKRVEVALTARRKGWRSWRHLLDKYDLFKFSTRAGVKGLTSYFAGCNALDG